MVMDFVGAFELEHGWIHTRPCVHQDRFSTIHMQSATCQLTDPSEKQLITASPNFYQRCKLIRLIGDFCSALQVML